MAGQVGKGVDARFPLIYHARMPLHLALLRAINVGGHNKIAMADLRDLAESLGLRQSKTLLQSGNLVFEGGQRAPSALEALLESETHKRLGVAVDYLVRSAAEWRAIIAANPFRREARSDPSHLVVMCMKDAPRAAALKALQAAIKGPEVVRADGRQVYITYPAGIGTSKLTSAVIEKQLGTRGTARNWNTVLKLDAMLSNEA